MNTRDKKTPDESTQDEGISDIRQVSVTKDLNGERLDSALQKLIPGHSRTSFKRLIKDGFVKRNGVSVTKQSLPVNEGDELEIRIPEPEKYEAVPVDIPLDILYEDDDVLVVNKPKGMVVHPAAGHKDDTLVNAVLAHCGQSLSGIGGALRPGIVHRIDKDTTGALLICKNDNAHLKLAGELKLHKIEREYVAIVYGIIKEDEGTVDKPIGRDENDRKKMAVTKIPGKGKQAVTHYKVLKRFEKDGFSYVSCRLETGRTHQIRVHMTDMGHPLLGDSLYAPGRKSKFKNLHGQCLHARTLGFNHPVTNGHIVIEAPLPEYFEKLLECLN